MTLDWQTALVAFAGGVLGAAVGAVPAFVFTGILVLAGVAALSGGGDSRLIAEVAFGPFFGPHVSFAGGVAAAAYAAKRGLMPSGRDVGRALMGLNSPSVLVVGGVFGAAGYVMNSVLVGIGAALWTDTIAVTVIISAFAARLLLGKTSIMGTVAAGGRYFHPDAVANWLPWQQKWSQLTVIGLSVGLVSGRLAQLLGATKGGDAIGFGLVTSFLVLLLMGNQIPVTHHIALTSAAAAILGAGLLTCALVGIAAAFVAEGVSRAFHIHGDTHVDPPAAAIAIVITALRLSAAAGIFTHQLP
jgi:hypothetical protein